MAGQAELAHPALLAPLAQLLADRLARQYQSFHSDSDHDADYTGYSLARRLPLG